LKKKLRTLVVDNVTYLWQFIPGTGRSEDPPEFFALERFTAYLAGYRNSRVDVFFKTWAGGRLPAPLCCGSPVDLDDPKTGGVNLHTPQWAAALIRAAHRKGWKPDTARQPFVIENGVELLKELGYSPEV
jgi:hypothetical protein